MTGPQTGQTSSFYSDALSLANEVRCAVAVFRFHPSEAAMTEPPDREIQETPAALALAQDRFARGEFAEAQALYSAFIGQCASRGR